MSFKKILVGLVFLVIAGIGFLAFYGLQNLDDIIRRGIVQAGSQATQTPVTLKQFNISLRSGSGELQGLKIANPREFSTPYALSIGKAKLQVDPKSILTDIIVVKEVTISGMALIAEQKGLKGLNLYTLAKNVKSAKQQKPQDSTATGAKPKVRFIIEKITFADNQLQLVSEQLGEKTLTLPPINLKDIGDRQTGLAPNELGRAILKPLLAQVTSEVKKQLKEQYKDKAKDKVKDKLKSLFGG